MRVAPALIAVPLLIALLTWLSIRAIDTDAERFDQALGEMDNFETLEAALYGDVLSARVGVLRNYDPLVQETDALGGSVGRLREILATGATIRPAIDDLAASVARQEGLVERFKSNNSLLQNSLAYFAVFDSTWDGSLAPSVSSLAAAILRLTLDTSTASTREVQSRLDDLVNQIPLSQSVPSAGTLIGHGRILRDLLPATDGDLRVLRSLTRGIDQQTLRATILTQQSLSRATARRFRVLLYVTSLILVGLLAHVGLQLHARSRTLRRRAAFEHVLAEISVRFIATRPQDLDAAVEQALAEMAQCVGADRSYFVLFGSQPRIYAWNCQDVTFPLGWPEQALSLADRHGPTSDGIVLVQKVLRAQPGKNRDDLATVAGVQGWACIVRSWAAGNHGVLGFDWVTHPCLITPAGELGLLRMAIETVAGALCRQSFERERSRLELRLQQARRMETVGTFATGIAHNFNNIVGAILGYTEMADERQSAAGILPAIHRAGERARELVDQIITFARCRDVHRHPVKVQALAAETSSLLRASLPTTVELVVNDILEELTVSGVHAQLQQVILNLCSNAAQAMDHVGRVELQIDACDVAEARSLSHGSLAPGRHVRMAVSDTGHGIDETALERIFEPFFTTRLDGTGLGLATTREIVREHGGAIHVESTVGVGTHFEVWLPRTAASVSPAIEDDAERSFGNGETILVVEKDPNQLLRDEEVLAALGYEPVGIADAAEALAMCREAPERFDALVIGSLESMTALLGFAAQLHEAAPGLSIILATASTADFAANALATAGISDVVHWPIITTEIASILHICLRRKQHITAVTRTASHAITA